MVFVFLCLPYCTYHKYPPCMLSQMARPHFLYGLVIFSCIYIRNICTYMYTCIYVYIHIQYVYIHIYTHTCYIFLIHSSIDEHVGCFQNLAMYICKYMYKFMYSIHIYVCSYIYTYIMYVYVCTQTHTLHFLIHSSIDRHKDCLLILAIINNTAINSGVHIPGAKFFKILCLGS